MKNNVCLICIIAALIFSGCSKKELNYKVSEVDGVKIYKNKNIPADEKLEIKVKELFTINAEDETVEDSTRTMNYIYTIEVDDEGSIYAVDLKKSNIKKFDMNGNFVLSFGKKGYGPGEMDYCSSAGIIGDKIYCNDYGARRVVIFDRQGNFIENMNMTGSMPQKYYSVDENKVLAHFDSWFEEDDKMYTVSSLILSDYRFENRKDTLRSKTMQMYSKDYNINDLFWARTYGNDKIFVASNSKNEFWIDVYDFSCNLLYKINKSYRKVRLPKNEIDLQNKAIREITNDPNFPESFEFYKKAVSALFYDKYDRLWVNSPVETINPDSTEFTGYSFDVFKEGVYLNRININFPEGYYPTILKNGRIYTFNRDKCDIKIFDY